MLRINKRSFAFPIVLMISCSGGVAAENTERAVSALDLPAIGYCPPAAKQPECARALEAYQTAYRSLVEATDRYYKALEAALDPPVWSDAVQTNVATALADIEVVATRVKQISAKVPESGRTFFIDAVATTRAAMAEASTKRNEFNKISFVARTSSPAFVRFLRNWRRMRGNPQICGIDKDLDSRCHD